MASMVASLTGTWSRNFGQRDKTSKREYSSLPDFADSTAYPEHGTRKWETIGAGEDYLLSEMRSVYWAGVRRELEDILLTLKQWQQEEYADVTLEEEKDEQWIHGYDTFIDSISEVGREAAERYRERRDGHSDASRYMSYNYALEEYGKDLRLSLSGDALRKAVRITLENKQVLDIVERRARMLLQSAGKCSTLGLRPENLT
jgi:hypothetical protein